MWAYFLCLFHDFGLIYFLSQYITSLNMEFVAQLLWLSISCFSTIFYIVPLLRYSRAVVYQILVLL